MNLTRSLHNTQKIQFTEEFEPVIGFRQHPKTTKVGSLFDFLYRRGKEGYLRAKCSGVPGTNRLTKAELVMELIVKLSDKLSSDILYLFVLIVI